MSSIKVPKLELEYLMPPNPTKFSKETVIDAPTMELRETRKLLLEKLCRPQGVSLHCGRTDLENVLVIDVIISEYYKDNTCIEYAPRAEESDHWIRLENCPTDFASTKYRKIAK